MDKQKLVRIIIKDLDELKTLSEEVAEIQDNASLIVDLALSKARLVCQEIELLREYSGGAKTSEAENEPETPEDEDPEISYHDPELEILHFDVPDLDEDSEENELENLEDEQPKQDEIPENEDETKEEMNLQEKEMEKEIAVEEAEEEEIIVYDEDEDEKAERAERDEVPDDEPEIQITELERGTPSEVREIHIDELDDDDQEAYKFSPEGATTERQAIHEIPKPEPVAAEKQAVGETFRKERSLNDAIAENKSAEPNLSIGPISSLRASVGLNDRFLFIREIFGNNAEKYNTVIDHLDKLETIQQAVEYLKANLSLEKNETSMKFVDLLKRRFSK